MSPRLKREQWFSAWRVARAVSRHRRRPVRQRFLAFACWCSAGLIAGEALTVDPDLDFLHGALVASFWIAWLSLLLSPRDDGPLLQTAQQMASAQGLQPLRTGLLRLCVDGLVCGSLLAPPSLAAVLGCILGAGTMETWLASLTCPLVVACAFLVAVLGLVLARALAQAVSQEHHRKVLLLLVVLPALTHSAVPEVPSLADLHSWVLTRSPLLRVTSSKPMLVSGRRA